MRLLLAVFLCLLVCLLGAPVVVAQEQAPETALVEVDGAVLFRVRGIEALPAGQRAANITARIVALAADGAFQLETLRVEEAGELTAIAGGTLALMQISDEDARLEGVQRSLLALVYVDRIRRAIGEYRDARTRARLAESAGRAAAAVGIAAVLLFLLLWLLRLGETKAGRVFDQRVGHLGTESRRMVRVDRLRQTLLGVVGIVRVAAILVITLLLLEYVLAQFPWTRNAGLLLFESIAGPLAGLGRGFVAAIPNLVLLAILFFVTRYGLALARLYFDAVEDGTIQINEFEPEWAQPTFTLVRIATIALVLVVAYPFIPGSDSEAFKGLSILAGVMLSLGSSTAIANVVAGYMILYRRSFRIGDRVRIGEVLGVVTAVRQQVTHIRTNKNEEITIPNASILGSEVINYSKPAREGKLILHTEVGIGYETPWRQVEALLIEAARRTPGVLKEPPPFVLQKKLGDFAVTYEINAYSDRSDAIPQTYADLHRNILDVFNEHGVQIMTPAYEGDPATPKVVAKDQWFTAPAEKKAE